MSEDVSEEESSYVKGASNAKQIAKRRSGSVSTFKVKLSQPGKESAKDVQTSCQVCQGDVEHYSCADCDKQYYSRLAILAHFRKHTHPPVICEICSKEFEFNHQLQKHKIKHSNERQFVCDVCEKTFKSQSTLMAHKHIHEPKRYLCKRCMKYFTQKINLQVHMRCHSGIKPYECKVCPKQFAQKTTLNNHMLKHTGEKPHFCTICKQRFRQVSNLKKHIERYPDNNCKKRKKKSLASNNNNKTTKKSKLKNQQNEDKPNKTNKTRSSISLAWFSCKKCNKTLAGSDNISKHKKICS